MQATTYPTIHHSISDNGYLRLILDTGEIMMMVMMIKDVGR